MKKSFKYSTIVFFICYGVNGFINKTEDAIFEYSKPLDCSETKFFDTSNFSCEKCPNNLISSENRLECICDENSRYTKTNSGESICELCDDQSVPTSDTFDCIYCQDNSTCQCSNNEIKIERYHNGTLLDFIKCLPCPEYSYLSIDGSKCLPCAAITVNNDNNDDYSTILHQRIQKYCLQSNLSTSWTNDKRAFEINFLNQAVDSYYLRAELLLAVKLCEEKHKKACEHLSHICLLTLQMKSIPCQLLYNVTSAENYFYAVGKAQTILNRTKVPPTYTLLTTSPNNKLHFSVATYTLEGQYESLEDWMPFCSSFNNIRFGVNTVKKCKASAEDIINSKTRFLVPYLSFLDSDNKKRLLYELPILIKNINADVKNVSQWQLARRFFTIDNVSGFKALLSSESSIFTKAPQPNAFRFIKSMNIQITMQSRENPGKIFPPLIVIEYDELSYQKILSDTEISIDYKVIFNFGDKESNIIIKIIIGVFSGLAIIHATLKTWSYCRKNGDNVCNVSTISSFIVYYFETIGNAFLSISICSCIYFFIFYKGQTVLHILLPNDEFETIIMILTMIAFGGKIVEILSLLYHHRRLNIFFIDWEQSRSILFPVKYDSPRTSLRKTYKKKLRREKYNLSETISEIVEKKQRRRTSSKNSHADSSRSRTKSESSHRRKKSSTRSKINFSTEDNKNDVSQDKWIVSIWRTYFVASQWLRIKTKRKTSIWFQIVGTIFLLEVIGLKYWALAVPELALRENSSTKKSFTLQYGVGVIIYVLIYTFQWSLSTLYEKYVKNSLQEFVDLCSVANISLFIFPHDYYGYYIHGRSVHGFADTDLLTLINDLRKEEHNLCAHRGLIPGTTEQTFIVCMSKQFRSFYNSILNAESTNSKNLARRHFSSVPIWDEHWQIYLKLRKFLCGFLDHCFESIDYTVKEKSFVEKLCNIEFFDTEKSIFYIDNNYSFDTTIFHGNEWTLATFELSIFVFVLALDWGYILSAIFTIFLSHMMIFIVRFNQNENLARRTLIDKRFLM